jgi:regulator of protease activity HflC (stomatin/prohibitin superfamily)
MKSLDKSFFAIVGVLITTVLVVLLSISTTISAGEVAITEFFGKVNPNGLLPGIHFILPLTKVSKISTRNIVSDFTIERVKAAGGVEMSVGLQANYSFKTASLSKLYSQFTPFSQEVLQKNLIEKAVRSAVLQALSTQEVATINNNQIQITEAVSDLIKKEFLELDAVNLNNLIITEFDTPDEIQTAINRQQIALQNKRTALVEQETAQIEATTNEIKAKGLSENVLIDKAIDACLKTGNCSLMPSPVPYGVSLVGK